MTVIIMRGIPGSGKSTWIKNNYPDAYVCSADHFFTDRVTGEYKWDRTKLKEAHDTCFAMFCAYVLFRRPLIVVDNTNIKVKDYQRYLDFAEKKGYTVWTRKIKCDPQVAFERCIHKVPLETIQRMHNDLCGDVDKDTNLAIL